MSQVQTAVQVKPVSKTTQCIRFYRTLVTKAMLEAGTEESKAQIREANKACKTHFVQVLGLTDKGANTYIQICKDRVLGNDPHAGRKLANKNRRMSMAQAEQPAEPVVEQVQHRWGVGADKSNIVSTHQSRSEAQKVAKEQNLKWFDTKLA